MATSRQGYHPKKARLKGFSLLDDWKKFQSFAAKIPSVLQVDQGWLFDGWIMTVWWTVGSRLEGKSRADEGMRPAAKN